MEGKEGAADDKAKNKETAAEEVTEMVEKRGKVKSLDVSPPLPHKLNEKRMTMSREM